MSGRLLLVDDEPRNLALLEAYLHPAGYTTRRAANGREALELCESDPPDLVLLDVVMPGITGLDVLAHLRAREEHVPVILVTGHSEREMRVQGLEAGADEFLEKPVDRDILLARVRTLLALKESRDALVEKHRALEQLQREQRELTGFIVHDLKSPLAVVWSGVDFAAAHLETDPRESSAALDDAAIGLRRLRELIDDLLVVSRLEQADLALRKEDVLVSDLLDAIVRAHEREAASRGLVVETHLAEARVRGDRALLARVAENLLDNALRYTPAGGRVTIGAQCTDVVAITFANSGQAIAMNDRTRVFEKFARGASAAPRAGSAGLGLYFCKRVVEAHGGTINLSELPDWPIAFVLHLPMA